MPGLREQLFVFVSHTLWSLGNSEVSQSPNAANLFILMSIKETHFFLAFDFLPTACKPWFFGYTSQHIRPAPH